MTEALAPFTIAALRAELGFSLEAFAVAIGVNSKGRMSEIERGKASPTAEQALRIEELSAGRINAAALHPLVARARDTAPGWQLSAAEIDSIAAQPLANDQPDTDAPRVVLCAVCELRLDEQRACSFADCPHAQREAA